jgi:hypothetical protein
MSNIQGKAYIYDFNNLVNNHIVGNVFYRNGKFILSNSGSVFNTLMLDRTNTNEPLYDITYKSQQTIYEKQVVCRIEPGEFNYSTNPTALVPNVFSYDVDQNRFFNFIDLDLICRYVNFKINSDYNWINYFNTTEDDITWYNYYSSKFNLTNNTGSNYIAPYTSYLESIYNTLDVDGNNKIYINDLYLLFKYFTNSLTKDVVFNYVDLKSSRKSVEAITSYLDIQTGKYGYGQIKPEFFNFEISSSMDKTGSYLAPFITTVGLYNGVDLIGVAKLGMPIKNSGELPLNILVKWDI